jgi:hypothetical protein
VPPPPPPKKASLLLSSLKVLSCEMGLAKSSGICRFDKSFLFFLNPSVLCHLVQLLAIRFPISNVAEE